MTLLQLFPKVLLADFLRYFVVAAFFFLVFWKALGKRLAGRSVFGEWAEAGQLWRELGFSMITVAIFALTNLGVVAGSRLGVLRVYADAHRHGVPYLILSVALIVLAHDTYFYWTHRAMHHSRLFGLFHRVHHLSVHPSPWTAYSFHPLEAVVQALFFPLYLALVPTHELVLFIFLSHMILRNVWGHLSVELLPGWFIKIPLVRWSVTTTHHSLHHRYSRTNFGLYFRFWDQLMKTEHPQYEAVYRTVVELGQGQPRRARQRFHDG